MRVHVRTEFGIEQNDFAPVAAVHGMSGMLAAQSALRHEVR